MSRPLGPEDFEPTLDSFAEFCGELVLEDRQRMALHDYERRMLSDLFAGCTETVVLISKKNGKSTLIAALALFHVLTAQDAEVPIAAAAAKQATVLYNQAGGFVRRSATIRENFVIRGGSKEIRSAYDDGRLIVMASDENTADGVIPTLAIVDELHRHKKPDLYGVFRDGLGPRNGQIITISTAGDNEESPLGLLRSRAYELPIQQTDLGLGPKYHYCRSANGQFVLHEWSLDMQDDRTDMELVKLANPAPWQTVEKLQERYESPSMTPWQWARFACGVWYPQGEGSAIRPEDWDALKNPHVSIPAGTPVLVGMDLGWKRESDTTALVPIAWLSDEQRVIGDPVILVPPGDGSLLDDRAIKAALLAFAGDNAGSAREIAAFRRNHPPELADRWAKAITENARPYRLHGVVYDPDTGGQQLVQTLERDKGWTFFEFSQKPTTLALADGNFLEAIRRRVLVHSGHSGLRTHALNAVEVAAAGGTMFYFGRAKDGPRLPTDALRAASMAHSVLVEQDGLPKAPPKRGRGGYHFG